MGQKGFFDIAQRYAGLDAKNDPLARIDEVVPWEDFRPRLEAAWRKPTEERKSPAGRKPWDAVVMFKAIVLCELYNLSDDQVEYQLRDRLSFMRFLGLGLEDKVPDAKTVWLYREQLAQAGVIETLFEDFDGYFPEEFGSSATGSRRENPHFPGTRRCPVRQRRRPLGSSGAGSVPDNAQRPVPEPHANRRHCGHCRGEGNTAPDRLTG